MTEAQPTVRLTEDEQRLAEQVANKRDGWNVEHGHANSYRLGARDDDRDRKMHWLGATSELAVAKFWDLEWEPVWDKLDKHRPDVGHLHVRSSDVLAYSLLIHPDDPDAPFVLAIVLDADRVSLRGWFYSRDAKQKQFWQTDTGRPCFRVKQRYLSPVSTCPCADADRQRECDCGRTLPASYPWTRCLRCELSHGA